MNFIWTLVTQVLENITAALRTFVPRLPAGAVYPPETHRREFSLEVVRPSDLLVLTLDFYNLRLTPPAAGSLASLERLGSGTAFIVAIFPPQSFAEQAFFEDANGNADPSDPVKPPPVGSRISNPSQLVFRLNDSTLPLDFTLDALLEVMQQSETAVQPRLTRPTERPPLGGQANFGGPRAQFSAIEAPYRLILSPNLDSRWEHATGVVTDAAGTRAELWHTRLTGKKPRVSAVWSPDYASSNITPSIDDATPFRMSLNNENRHEIVRSTSDATLVGAAPAKAEQLILSSQGAWLNLHGQWETDLNLVEWRHLAAMGRDNYVRVVKAGNLFCLGHRAVFVKITERKVQMVTSAGIMEGRPAAYLRQRYLIILREPTKTYAHRHMPFRTVTIKTAVTPSLDLPKNTEIFPASGENAFWPRVLGKDFEFHIVANDWEGREVEFRMPLAFVVKTTANDTTQMQKLVQQFNEALSENDPRRQREIGGQKIAFAPAKVPNDTTLETGAFIFGALNAKAEPAFLPSMHKARSAVSAVQRIAGTSELSTIALDPKFLAGAGNAIGNMTEVFAYLTDKRTPVAFPKEKLGGMVAPNFDISSLSRAFGPAGGDATAFADGTFDPLDVFKDVKLLGGIKLGEILRPLKNATQNAASAAIPGLKNVRTTKPGLGDVFETTYHWDIDDKFLQDSGIFKKKPGGTFSIHTVLDTPLNGAPPQFTVDGGLTKFAVTLLPGAELIALNFDQVEFHAGSEKKIDFGIVFDGFEFLGPLSFVNKLKDVIPLDGFDDPPFLDIVLPPKDHPGITAGFTLGIPTVGVGIFVLQNISFGASFFLPFIGEEPNLRLAFCERHQPFTLTVSLFGGGGFFALDIGLAGVKMIEAALEFGAAIALNLGVAEGTASIMGGVYYQKSGEGFLISAYFRANGALEVLGIITVSVELYIALSYESRKSQPHGGKLWGEASVKVKIKIAFFSVSVSISIEREFAGSDPKFLEAVTPADWSEYCEAFADYPA